MYIHLSRMIMRFSGLHTHLNAQAGMVSFLVMFLFGIPVLLVVSNCFVSRAVYYTGLAAHSRVVRISFRSLSWSSWSGGMCKTIKTDFRIYAR